MVPGQVSPVLWVPGGWHGSRVRVGRTHRAFAFGTQPAPWGAGAGSGRALHCNGVSSRGAGFWPVKPPPRVTGGADCLMGSAAGVILTPWSWQVSRPTRAPARGSQRNYSFHNRPALCGWLEVSFALPRRMGFSLMSF